MAKTLFEIAALFEAVEVSAEFVVRHAQKASKAYAHAARCERNAAHPDTRGGLSYADAKAATERAKGAAYAAAGVTRLSRINLRTVALAAGVAATEAYLAEVENTGDEAS